MNLSDHKIVFTGAGQQQIQVQGRFIRVREALGDVFLSLDGSGEVERQKGEEIDIGVSNRRVYVRSEIAQTIKLTAADNPQSDNRTAVSVSTTTTIDPSNNFSGVGVKTCPASGSVNLVPANANRVRLLIKIPTDQNGGVWLAGAGESANNGYFLEEGESITLGTTAELWAYGAGDDVNVSVLEENVL